MNRKQGDIDVESMIESVKKGDPFCIAEATVEGEEFRIVLAVVGSVSKMDRAMVGRLLSIGSQALLGEEAQATVHAVEIPNDEMVN